MKHLNQLLSAVTVLEIVGGTDREIRDITDDSRRVSKGAMFIAVRGVNVDGHAFIPEVSSAGAGAVVCEEFPGQMLPQVTYIKVPSSAVALGQIADQWWDNPSGRLSLIGVTGTNGKTTIASLIYEMARLTGYKAGLISTVCNYIETEAVPATQTTPGPLTINELLSKMVKAGCRYAVMEVSSHACAQHRIAGLRFAGGIFSNLTRDHLDYHKTFDAYLAAKKSFFDRLPSSAFALTNIDDKNGKVMLQNTLADRKTYSLRTLADFTGRIIESRLDGTLMAFNSKEAEVLFTGRFNAYNLLAVYGASLLLGWDPDRVLVNMSRLVPVAGRFQTFRSPQKGYVAIIDYAHTPDAIANVLEAVREIIGGKGKIITVVGAGGNRDKGKRPMIARQAALRSDYVILTSDNPRDEDPLEIIHDMEVGNDDCLKGKSLCLADRRQAITAAAAMAKEADVILIAGKGHETYQEINGIKHPFDDKEVVKEIFENE